MGIINVVNPGDGNDIKPNIQTAVNSASNGDIIAIPAGSFAFSGMVTITNFISVSGAGISATTLYRTENTVDATLDFLNMFYINTDSREPSNLTISDMTLKSKIPKTVVGGTGSTARDSAIQFKRCLNFVVRDCRFMYFGNGAVSVTHDDDLAGGLIHNNQFYYNAKDSDGRGLGYGVVIYGLDLTWVPKPRFGSDNFIFIEDNTFDWHRHSVAAGGGGLYVARYNTITNNIINDSASVHAFDAHAGRGSGTTIGSGNYFGTRATEAYNNTFTETLFFDRNPIVPNQNSNRLAEIAIQMKGGESLIFNNVISGYRFGSGAYTDRFDFGTTYPLPYTMGYPSGIEFGTGHTGTDSRRANGDLFYWNNTFTPYVFSAGSSTSFVQYSQTAVYYVQNRDYHLVSKPFYVPYRYPHPLTRRP